MVFERIAAASIAVALCTGMSGAATLGPSATGIDNPDEVVGFDEVALANGTAVTDQYAAFGVTFSPAVYYAGTVSARQGFSNPAALNFGQGNVAEPFSINFTNVVDAASFAFTWSGDALFEAFLNGALVESFTADARLNQTNFFGFTDILFDEIKVSREVNSFDRTGALDTISYSVAAVPLPASALLMLGGLGALAAARRKRA